MKRLLIVLVLLTVNAFLIHSLYKDINHSIKRSENKLNAVAKLVYRHNEVMRRFSNSIVWEDIGLTQALYQKDSVITLDDSEATILFNEGDRIDLEPNSLIILERAREDYVINFIKGSALANTSVNGLRVKFAGKEARLSSGQSVISRDKVEVFSGKAFLGKKSLRVIKSDLKLISPKNNEKILITKKDKRVDFRWQYKGGKSGVRVEVSKTRDFKKIVFSRSNIRTGGVSGTLRPGIYFCRIKSGKKTSYTYKFSIKHIEPTRLVYPEDGQTYSISESEKGIKFKWNSSEIHNTFKIEISKNSSFKKIYKKIETTKKRSLVNLDEGVYYARVVSRSGYQKSPLLSKAISFKVRKILKLPGPNLISPNANDIFFMHDDFSKDIYFSWDPVDGSDYYKLLVSRDRSFTKIILNKELKGTRFKPQGLKLGRYFWGVKAVSRTQGSSTIVRPRRFWIFNKPAINLRHPGDRKVLLQKDPFDIYSFKWSSESKLKGRYYYFILSKSRDLLIQTSRLKTRSNSLKITIPDLGKYYWKILELKSSGDVVASSEIQSFRIREYPFLSSPMLMFPLKGQRFEYFSDSLLTFKWSSKDKAKTYIFSVFSLQDDVFIPIIEKELSESQIKIPIPKKGIYAWSVKSKDDKGVHGIESKKREFTVIPEKKLKLPKNYKIDVK